MEQKKIKTKKNGLLSGFTLVEMLVVIAIISLLSSIIFVGVQSFKGKARDSRRISDLSQIRTALIMYNTAYNSWIETGGSCSSGNGGGGNGWFNYDYGGAPISIVQCLIGAGFLSAEIIDPTGNTRDNASEPINNTHAYMKCSCNPNILPLTTSNPCTLGGPCVTYLYANLEGRTATATTVNGTCCSGYDSTYGMDYYLKIQ